MDARECNGRDSRLPYSANEPKFRRIDQAYDARSAMTTIVDQNGNRTSYTFDEINRMVTRKFASLDITSYGYDLNSR
ncbi:MAG TPA: hypothetical protein PKA27_16560, partial [Fimbriimonadaceae bacterium]|nr:hypothetical protein [Fimbriimonadaceae bacterium]